MTAPKPVKSIPLDNGNTLQILNASRKLAGDAWLVKIIFRIEVTIDALLPKGKSLGGFGLPEIKAALGETVAFEVIRERNFINEKEKDTLAEIMVNDYLQHILGYISQADFPEKLVIKKFMEHRKNRLPPGYM